MKKIFASLLMTGLVSSVLTTGAQAADKTELVIYSPHGIELLTEIEKKFEEANPEIDLVINDIGGAEAKERIIAEKENPQANILYGGPSSFFYTLKNEGVLVPYAPKWGENVDATYVEEEKAFSVPMVSPTTFGINTEAGVEMPKSWLELADEKYQGKIITAMPSSSAYSTCLSVIAYMFDEKGTLDTEGKEWFEKFSSNIMESAKGDIQRDKLAKNTDGAAVSMFVVPTWENYIKQGDKLAYNLEAEEGIIEIKDCLAIIAGTEKDEAKLKAAQAFIDFAGSTETQLFLADEFNRVPTDPKAKEQAKAEWMKKEYKVIDIDWKKMTEKQDAYLDQIFNQWL